MLQKMTNAKAFSYAGEGGTRSVTERVCRGRRPRLPTKNDLYTIINPRAIACPDPRVTFGVKSHQKRRGPSNM